MFKKTKTFLGVLTLSFVLIGGGCAQQAQIDSSTNVQTEQQQESEQMQEDETTSEDQMMEDSNNDMQGEVDMQGEADMNGEMKGGESNQMESESEAMIESETSVDIEAGSEMDSEAEMKVVNISGGEFYFDPSEIRVEKGQKVKVNFKNVGSMGHNLRIPALKVGTPVIQAGQSASFTFTAEEDMEFECTIPGHADQGMTGAIIVE